MCIVLYRLDVIFCDVESQYAMSFISGLLKDVHLFRIVKQLGMHYVGSKLFVVNVKACVPYLSIYIFHRVTLGKAFCGLVGHSFNAILN